MNYHNSYSPLLFSTGDSGGGQVFYINGKFYIEGLVSNTIMENRVCNPQYYSVYTNVTYYAQWILDNIRLNSPAYSERLTFQ